MKDIPSLFGSMVFNDSVMRDRLPSDVYQALKQTVSRGRPLPGEIANVVAGAMKDWAVEKGATHFTHWFQPLTGVTAEKHDSFISPAGDGRVIMEFSGRELIQGESDASSLPSGGLRATFEARGYTVWDATSWAFIKDNTLCIPTAFCSFGGEALDMKTPLLRSMEAISFQALRVLRLFGNTTASRVIATVGAEQEYFLIDKETYLRRPDLIYTGRALFGAPPPKGQELEDHYFGSLKLRVASFMKELEEELWKLGVYVKTRHNESAPAQHEIVPLHITANVATDQNQLVMELAKSVANRHNMACLLHEKPFASVNGSGKHNNWSLTVDGVNLLEPGETPYENAQFLLFLTAVIKAVDEYQDLLRMSAASAGNDHRLGENEAPPVVISMFLGDELTAVLDALKNRTDYHGKVKMPMEVGVTTLPRFPQDITDRNRTSPLAFTGNKFEFRMLGSAFSLAGPNIVINTAVAESLRLFADALEGTDNFNAVLSSLIRETIRRHDRIIFNGNSYASEWVAEARTRGLSCLRTTVDALPAFLSPKSVSLFSVHKVFTQAELNSRYEILLEVYCKTIHIEALSLLDMVKKEIIPACVGYQNELARLLLHKKDVDLHLDSCLETGLLVKLSDLSATIYKSLSDLENTLRPAEYGMSILSLAEHCRDRILRSMASLRRAIDEAESIVAKKYWPFPTIAEMLYSVT